MSPTLEMLSMAPLTLEPNEKGISPTSTLPVSSKGKGRPSVLSFQDPCRHDNVLERPDIAEYYASLLVRHQPESQEGHQPKLLLKYINPAKGKGLFAAGDGFQEHDLILAETVPSHMSLQNQVNRSIAFVCSECFHFLGSLQVQVEHILKRALTQSEVDDLAKHEKRVANRFRPIVTCARGCEEEVYCSEECMNLAWGTHHQVLCPGAHPERREAILDFDAHADETNEIFRMAAKMYASLAIQVQEGKDLSAALVPYHAFVKAKWWDILAHTDDDPTRLTEILHTVLADSLRIMRHALGDRSNGLESLMTVDEYALMIGMFERNNLSIVVPNPLAAVWDELPMALQKELKSVILRKVTASPGDHEHHEHGEGCCSSSSDGHDDASHSHDADEEEEGHDDEDMIEAVLYLICEGTALHPLQSTINHSCAPNARVWKEDSVDLNGTTIVRALRRIEPGEEIVISYLDEGDDEIMPVRGEVSDEELEERRTALQDYGIAECHCTRCRA